MAEKITPLKPAINNLDQSKKIRKYADIIEKFYNALNIVVKINEVNIEPQGIQFCLMLTMGTTIESVTKHQKELAQILGSPNKRVEIEAPIPGRNLIGITLPRVYPYLEIPPSETPDSDVVSIDLLNKSFNLFQLYEKIVGKTDDNEKISDDKESVTQKYLYLKEKFFYFEKFPDLRSYALMIEITYGSFGLPVKIIEVDSEPEYYLFKVKPDIEMEAKDIAKYRNDLALAMAVPVENISLTVPLPGRIMFGVSLARVNFFGKPINVLNRKSLPEINGYFRKVRAEKMRKNSWNYFLRFERKYRQEDKFSICNKYLKMYKNMYAGQLVDVFNSNLGKTGSVREINSLNLVLQDLFTKRKIDYSEIAQYSGGLSFKNKIILEKNKILVV